MKQLFYFPAVSAALLRAIGVDADDKQLKVGISIHTLSTPCLVGQLQTANLAAEKRNGVAAECRNVT